MAESQRFWSQDLFGVENNWRRIASAYARETAQGSTTRMAAPARKREVGWGSQTTRSGSSCSIMTGSREGKWHDITARSRSGCRDDDMMRAGEAIITGQAGA